MLNSSKYWKIPFPLFVFPVHFWPHSSLYINKDKVKIVCLGHRQSCLTSIYVSRIWTFDSSKEETVWGRMIKHKARLCDFPKVELDFICEELCSWHSVVRCCCLWINLTESQGTEIRIQNANSEIHKFSPLSVRNESEYLQKSDESGRILAWLKCRKLASAWMVGD